MCIWASMYTIISLLLLLSCTICSTTYTNCLPIIYIYYTHIKLLVDQADALSFKEGEEVTFLRWGNFYIDKIVKNESGDRVISMEVRV